MKKSLMIFNLIITIIFCNQYCYSSGEEVFDSTSSPAGKTSAGEGNPIGGSDGEPGAGSESADGSPRKRLRAEEAGGGSSSGNHDVRSSDSDVSAQSVEFASPARGVLAPAPIQVPLAAPKAGPDAAAPNPVKGIGRFFLSGGGGASVGSGSLAPKVSSGKSPRSLSSSTNPTAITDFFKSASGKPIPAPMAAPKPGSQPKLGKRSMAGSDAPKLPERSELEILMEPFGFELKKGTLKNDKGISCHKSHKGNYVFTFSNLMVTVFGSSSSDLWNYSVRDTSLPSAKPFFSEHYYGLQVAINQALKEFKP